MPTITPISPPPVPRYNVLGVGICGLEREQVVSSVLDAAAEGRPLGVSALAVHAIMEAWDNPACRARLNSLDIATPDGQPVRWALNQLHGTTLRDRVYGPFVMRDLCAGAATRRLPIYLFGTPAETLQRLSERLRESHPGLEIAGSQPSRFRKINAEEADSDAQRIRESGARLVFCGLGCPRQEAWVHAMKPRLNVPLIAVGAAFALWAGERSMAPAWAQDHGLEWLVRLSQEPRRLAARYLIQNPRFLAALALQKLGRRPFNDAPTPVEPEYWG
jgi:N-acetylglucosaminyldiphosphoundecaprenol N-acetyl-beta-D-mannosaminyltransferase